MIKTDKYFSFFQLTIFLLSIFLVIITIFSYNNNGAYAHPVVIDSDPKQFQSIESPPDKVTVYFSEPIVLQYSQISVIDSEGKEIEGGQAEHINNDPATISIPIKENDINNEGAFTVTTKVLSAVDGHVVDNSVVFNVGKDSTSTSADFANMKSKEKKGIFDILSIENSASRIAGYIGQIMLVGAPCIYLWITKPFLNIRWIKDMLQNHFDSIQKNLVKTLIFSDFLVIVSVIAIVTIQASAIDGTITDVFNTEFGKIIIVRLFLTLILLTILLITFTKVRHSKNQEIKNKTYSIIIGLGLGILFTNSMISHAAALDNFVPILLDYFHGIAASLWIGGLIFLAFVFINQIRKIQHLEIKSKIVSITIDKFSVIVLPILASIVITGPTLLWSLENNLSTTFASLYGKILIIKLVLAGIMIIIGAYHQVVTSKKMKQILVVVTNKLENKDKIVSHNDDDNNHNNNHEIKKFVTTLRVETVIGISLLFVVSLMTNMVLPSGEISPSVTGNSNLNITNDDTIKNSDNNIKDNTHFSTTLYSDDNKIKILLDPLTLGENKMSVNFIDYNNNPADDVGNATIKLSQLENNIGPIPIEMDTIGKGEFSANIPLSTYGNMEYRGSRKNNKT